MRRASNRLVFVPIFTALLLSTAARVIGQSWSGEAAIEVRVDDARGKPVEGAEVALTLLRGAGVPLVPVLTDGKGRAAIGGLAPGSWAVEVRKSGFMVYQAEIAVAAGEKPGIVTAMQQNVPGASSTLRVRFAKTKDAPPARAGARIATAPAVPAPAPSAIPAEKAVEPAPTPAAPASEFMAPTTQRSSPVAPPASPEPLPASAAAPAPVAAAPPAPPSKSSGEPAAPAEPRLALPASAPELAPATPAPAPAAREEVRPAAPSVPAAPPAAVAVAEPVAEPVEAPPAPAPSVPEPATKSPAVELPAPIPTAESPAPEPAAGQPEARPATPAPAPKPDSEPVPAAAPPPAELPVSEAPPPAPMPASEVSAPPPARPEPAPPVAPAPVVRPAPAVAPVPAAPSAPAAPRPAQRAIERDCGECRSGESGQTVAISLAGGQACPEGLRDRLADAAETDLSAIVGTLPEGCAVLRIDLPAGSRFSGFRYQAQVGDGIPSDCLPGQGCRVGGCRFVGAPVVRREGASTTLLAIFEAREPRSGLLTVYGSSSGRR